MGIKSFFSKPKPELLKISLTAPKEDEAITVESVDEQTNIIEEELNQSNEAAHTEEIPAASFFGDKPTPTSTIGNIEIEEILNDDEQIDQLIMAITAEIINDNDRKKKLAEQIAIRLKNYLGITEQTSQDPDNRLLEWFRSLRTKLNQMEL